ncbi:hypothetical protein L1887_61042 [Cichorium endivia]|nr:hypothetical protein L1887_61042 [Cichorium endivia]
MLSSGAGSSIRKKRNFKGLQLAESPLASPAGAASTPNNGESSAASNASTIGKSATVTPGGSLALPGRNGAEAEPNSGANYHNKLTQQLANLELGVEYKLDLKNEDLKTVSELGAGNGGTVTKRQVGRVESGRVGDRGGAGPLSVCQQRRRVGLGLGLGCGSGARQCAGAGGSGRDAVADQACAETARGGGSSSSAEAESSQVQGGRGELGGLEPPDVHPGPAAAHCQRATAQAARGTLSQAHGGVRPAVPGQGPREAPDAQGPHKTRLRHGGRRGQGGSAGVGGRDEVGRAEARHGLSCICSWVLFVAIAARHAPPHSDLGRGHVRASLPKLLSGCAGQDGQFRRQVSAFRNTISPDGPHEPERGRYILYCALICPWACRTLHTRALKQLEDIIDVAIVHYELTPNGWSFARVDEVETGDPVHGFENTKQLYLKADPEYTARYTVPILWDKKLGTIVNNESSEIIRASLLEAALLGRKRVSRLHQLYPYQARLCGCRRQQGHRTPGSSSAHTAAGCLITHPACHLDNVSLSCVLLLFIRRHSGNVSGAMLHRTKAMGCGFLPTQGGGSLHLYDTTVAWHSHGPDWQSISGGRETRARAGRPAQERWPVSSKHKPGLEEDSVSRRGPGQRGGGRRREGERERLREGASRLAEAETEKGERERERGRRARCDTHTQPDTNSTQPRPQSRGANLAPLDSPIVIPLPPSPLHPHRAARRVACHVFLSSTLDSPARPLASLSLASKLTKTRPARLDLSPTPSSLRRPCWPRSTAHRVARSAHRIRSTIPWKLELEAAFHSRHNPPHFIGTHQKSRPRRKTFIQKSPTRTLHRPLPLFSLRDML